jgi:hypothetical protein
MSHQHQPAEELSDWQVGMVLGQNSLQQNAIQFLYGEEGLFPSEGQSRQSSKPAANHGVIVKK